jgi:hypothetical protein
MRIGQALRPESNVQATIARVSIPRALQTQHPLQGRPENQSELEAPAGVFLNSKNN